MVIAYTAAFELLNHNLAFTKAENLRQHNKRPPNVFSSQHPVVSQTIKKASRNVFLLPY